MFQATRPPYTEFLVVRSQCNGLDSISTRSNRKHCNVLRTDVSLKFVSCEPLNMLEIGLLVDPLSYLLLKAMVRDEIIADISYLPSSGVHGS
jgi:hypothetical protein